MIKFIATKIQNFLLLGTAGLRKGVKGLNYGLNKAVDGMEAGIRWLF